MKFVRLVVVTVTAALSVLATGADASTAPAQADSYETLCVIQTIPGHPLPEVCVPYPL